MQVLQSLTASPRTEALYFLLVEIHSSHSFAGMSF